MLRTALLLLFLLLLLLGLSSCIELEYYLSSATGHLQIISKRQSIKELLQQDSTSADLKERLEKIDEIRNFASQKLDLPENDSYRSYVELNRPYVLWNVVATPEFSLTPLQWCFPIAGCVSYRGYFNQDKAKKFARSLDEKHYDTAIIGVPAYSTLNWFDDPILSTFSKWPTPSIAQLIFHELAHQKLYVPDDSVFNESFATSVAGIGMQRWLETQDNPKLTASYQRQRRYQQEFQRLLLTTRGKLEQLYSSSLDQAEMRSRKQAVFAELRAAYSRLRDSWQGYHGYDAWFSQVNNARFASINTYHRWVPAFELAFEQEHEDLPAFFRRCQAIAELPEAERHELLDRLSERARTASGERPGKERS